MRLNKDDELELIKRACEGDNEAFRKLQEAYWKAVYGFIRAHVKQDADAEDVAQETWIQVWQKLPTYVPNKSSFFTWVRYWASVKLLRYYKKLENWRRVHVLFSELRALYPDLETEEEIEDIIDRLAAAVAKPDIPTKEVEEFAYLLRTTFEKGGYPWQLIAFGFSKLIDGWKPRRIVAELSDTFFCELSRKLEDDYLADSMLPEKEARSSFEHLRMQMCRLVREVLLPEDKVSQEALENILDMRVGETRLRDYYGSNPTASISDWSYKVRQKVLREIVQKGEFDC